MSKSRLQDESPVKIRTIRRGTPSETAEPLLRRCNAYRIPVITPDSSLGIGDTRSGKKISTTVTKDFLDIHQAVINKVTTANYDR